MLAVAVWHAAYDAGAGTRVGDGLVAPIVTACVIFWAVSLLQRHRGGLPAFGDPLQQHSSGRGEGELSRSDPAVSYR